MANGRTAQRAYSSTIATLLKTSDLRVITTYLDYVAAKKVKGHWPYRIGSLAENASANISPDTWIKEKSTTLSQHFVILDPSGNRPPGKPTISPLDQLVTKLVKYVMREEPCFSIITTALVKVRQVLGVLTSYHDVLLIWRAKRITRACFTRLLTERLAQKNSLSSTSDALVA